MLNLTVMNSAQTGHYNFAITMLVRIMYIMLNSICGSNADVPGLVLRAQLYPLASTSHSSPYTPTHLKHFFS